MLLAFNTMSRITIYTVYAEQLNFSKWLQSILYADYMILTKFISHSLLMSNCLQSVNVIIWCIPHLPTYICVYLYVDKYLNVQLLG